MQQVFKDLAKGKPFPTCSMSGAGNSANHAWSSAPTFCPPQYTRVFDAESAPIYQCDYTGAISVSVNGARKGTPVSCAGIVAAWFAQTPA